MVGLFCWTEDSLGWTESLCNLTISGIGWVESMAIDQNDVLFAGTILKGMFRSTDNGNNWIPVNNGLKTNTIYSIAISPTGSIFASMDDGIYRSKDGGNNWSQVSSIEDITSLIVSSKGLIFAGHNGETKGNLYLSDNDGTSWKKIDDDLSNKFILSIITNSNNQIFVGTYGGGVFCTNDIGKTWINTNEGIIDPFVTKLIANSNLAADQRIVLKSIWEQKGSLSEQLRDRMLRKEKVLKRKLELETIYLKRFRLLKRLIKVSERLQNEEEFIEYQKEIQSLKHQIKDQKIRIQYYMERVKEAIDLHEHAQVYSFLYSFCVKLEHFIDPYVIKQYKALTQSLLDDDPKEFEKKILKISALKERMNTYVSLL